MSKGNNFVFNANCCLDYLCWVMYRIATIIKKGVELQNENDLTV